MMVVGDGMVVLGDSIIVLGYSFVALGDSMGVCVNIQKYTQKAHGGDNNTKQARVCKCMGVCVDVRKYTLKHTEGTAKRSKQGFVNAWVSA